MNISLCEKFLQITLFEDNPFLKKAINYANKHFQKSFRLSSSVLILDDGERFKKDYLINWAYYTSVSEYGENTSLGSANSVNVNNENGDELRDSIDALSNLLEHTYLPIRIKILANNALLVRVCLKLRMLNLNKVAITLDKPNQTTIRYLAKIFRDEWLGSDKCEVYLDSSSQSFWEKITALTSFKIIHNVILNFDFKSFESASNSLSFSSFLTEQERELQKAYMILECHLSDPFEEVKKSYLRLVKEYHPDNVYGAESQLVEYYKEQFVKIQNAYEIVKSMNKTAI